MTSPPLLIRRRFLLSVAGVSVGTVLQGRPACTQPVHNEVAVKRFYMDSRWGQLHGYRAEPDRSTDKPPLICLHQTPSSAKIFAAFIAEMGRDRTAIAFDNPGYGASDGPAGRVPLEAYAETIADALVTLGFGDGGTGKVDMLGMLTGAKIGGELARSRPDLVRRLVLVQSLVMPEEDRLALKAELEGGVRESWAREGANYYLTRLQTALANRDPDQTVDQVIADFADSLVAGEDYLKGGMTALSYPAEEKYKDISQPALVIALSDERSEAATGAAAIIPNAQLLRLPDHSRHTFRSDPDALAKPVRAFLDVP